MSADDDSRTAAFEKPFRPSNGASPSMNWNSGIKSKIRTSLGARSGSRTAPNQTDLVIPSQNEAEPRDRLDQSPSASGPESKSTSSDQAITQDHASKPRLDDSTSVASVPASTDGALESGEVKSSASLVETLDDSTSDDDGVILNLQTDEHESGEISEDERQGLDGADDPHDIDTQYDTKENDEKADHEAGDAMADYADSNQLQRVSPTAIRNQIIVQHPRKLADLGREDLEVQLRYFYVGRDLTTINYEDPVKCLVCSEAGHTADECSKLYCSTCGTYKDHFSHECPKIRKCPKCRERGHDNDNCPYKLGRLNAKEVQCDLCQREGHVEEACELVWRTSGKPWEATIAKFAVHLSCYECGMTGHLGNQCPTRNPRKPLGSSTWAIYNGGATTAPPEMQNLSIKGRAQQKRVAGFDSSSEDDRDNFYRPRIPPPARRGQIRVASENIGRSSDRHWSAINAPSPRREGYDDRYNAAGSMYEREDYRGQPPGANSYRPSARYERSPHRGPSSRLRSRSPAFRDPVRTVNYRDRIEDASIPSNYSYNRQPPLPPGPAPPKPKAMGKRAKRRANEQAQAFGTYTPMPSAGKHAWDKHRL
ncbi:hypothetical protein MMC09_000518 [Bachmanniomyces sp. S44760]|nr:hypothetical protein [Bachmanniomyces sp. S44760]